MSFLRQLFGITTRKSTTEQKLHRSNHKAVVTAMNYEKEEEGNTDDFFDYIIGYHDVKKFLRMSINAEEPVHILLIGPHSF